MKMIVLALRIIIFLMFLALATNNNHRVDVHLLFDVGWTMPLSLLALILFALGAVAGVLAALGMSARRRMGWPPSRWRKGESAPSSNDMAAGG
jgi:uncharacterized integral membrane protein